MNKNKCLKVVINKEKKFGTLHEFACHPCAKYFPLLEAVISKS